MMPGLYATLFQTPWTHSAAPDAKKPVFGPFPANTPIIDWVIIKYLRQLEGHLSTLGEIV